MKKKNFKINYLFRSEFVKNSLILSIGSVFSQLIPIAIAPVLTRYYSPENYGALAIFVSIASLISIISTMRYEISVALPKKDEDAINIVVLSIIINLIISFCSLIIFLFFHKNIAYLLKIDELSVWLLFIPLFVIFSGAFQILNYWCIRFGFFKKLSISRIIQALTGSGTNLILGVNNFGAPGLIFGLLAGQFVSFISLFFQNLKGLKNRIKFVTKINIISQMKIYKEFPIVNSVQAIMDVLRDSLIILLISNLFNSQILGLYTFTLRILKVPSTFIGMAVSQVFLQKAKDLFNNGENLNGIVLKIMTRLILFALPVFLVIFILSPFLFGIIFGEKWNGVGFYTRILTPWIFMNFVVSPLSQIPIIVGKQRQVLGLGFIGSLLMIISILFGKILFEGIIPGLIFLSVSQFIFLSFVLLWIYKISNWKKC